MQDFYKKTLKRNLNEVGIALLEYRVRKGLYRADTDHPPVDFVQVVNWALFNDCIAHAIKALERKKLGTFWAICIYKKKDVDGFCVENDIDRQLLNSVSEKLKNIRNKTHFHIDHEVANDVTGFWKEINLKEDDLVQALEHAWDIMSFLHEKDFGEVFPLPEYDGEDAEKVAVFVQNLRQDLRKVS